MTAAKQQRQQEKLGAEIIALVEPYKKGVSVEVPEIADEADYVARIEFAKSVKLKMGEVDAAYDDLIAQAHKTHKAIIDKKKVYYQPLKTLFDAVERRLTQFRRKKEEERQAEERRLQALAQEQQRIQLTQEAATLEQEGRPEEAALVLDEAMNVPAPVIHAPSTLPTVNGAFGRKKPWQFEILKPDLIREEYWCPDLDAIAALVKAKGPAAESLLGKGSVRIYQDTSTVIKV